MNLSKFARVALDFPWTFTCNPGDLDFLGHLPAIQVLVRTGVPLEHLNPSSRAASVKKEEKQLPQRMLAMFPNHMEAGSPR